MNSWKVILATIVIFGAGVMTGGLMVRYTENRQTPARPHNGNATRAAAPFSAGGLRLEFLRRAQKELDLSAEQRERIDKIIKESQERTRKIMEPIQPELQGELRETKERFLEVLTPEQRARFEELIKKQQQRIHDQRHPHPGETSMPTKEVK